MPTTATLNGAANGSNGSSPPTPAARVAVIGGGVAGMAAAWHLAVNTSQATQVQIFEAESTLGGHAHTVSVSVDDANGDTTKTSTVDVDIGFMVFNHSNYPNMRAWFDALSSSFKVVQEEDSDMSLSVSLDQGQTVEWSSDGLTGLFANPKQAVNPQFYSFLKEMIRFNTTAPDLLQLHDEDPRKHVTMQQYLRHEEYSNAFCHYYLLPMMAATWSASMAEVLEFPAAQLISFFCNHKLLQILNRPQWKTVSGRSKQYTTAVQAALEKTAKEKVVHLSTPICAVEQKTASKNGSSSSGSMYEVFTSDRKSVGIFDQVIFACHPPTASRILRAGLQKDSKTSFEELLDLLDRIQYQDNVVYLHSDPALMPQRKAAWTSWNCLGNSKHIPLLHQPQEAQKKREAMEGAESGFGNTIAATSASKQPDRSLNSNSSSNKSNGTTNGHHAASPPSPSALEGRQGRMKAVYVTYWLNRLQNLNCQTDIFVSLNPHDPPHPTLTHKRVYMAHPQFTKSTLEARQRLNAQYVGRDGLWFCGAWQGYGFHEDGCRSGFEVATTLSGVPLPWVVENESDSDKTTTTTVPSNSMVLAPPDFTMTNHRNCPAWLHSLYRKLTHDVPVAICKRLLYFFIRQAVQKGTLQLKLNDGSIESFGDSTPFGGDNHPVTLRVFDDWFFVKTALEYDLGLARSYMAGYFVVEPLDNVGDYHPVMRPPNARDETTVILGDPVGLTRLFLLLVANRDNPPAQHLPRKSGRGSSYTNALTTASGLFISKIGSLVNYMRYKLTMGNSEQGGSLKNIHAHYDLSNDLFMTFLDRETLMYSCGIWDAVKAPSPTTGLAFRGTLAEAQWRKLDNLVNRAQIQPGQTVLDIGFGWGGLSIHVARKFGCKVVGITLSVEQKALAEQCVEEQGLESLITFEVVDYRKFARRKENWGKFDRVVSCEMIEAVGHENLGEFYWAVEQVLAHDGILVMQAITTPEQRYETYIRSTDFINTIIFPGGCAPSLHALVDAAYQQSTLTLEHVDNIGLHYAQTLTEWRRRFNAKEDVVRSLAFDDVFLRCWNYYLSYCEAGFFSQTVNCLVLVFSRPGCSSLVPLCETRVLTQSAPLTAEETKNWLADQ